jgi:carboxyl-terminal processing protease
MGCTSGRTPPLSRVAIMGAVVLFFAAPIFAQLTAEQKRLNLESFEKVWTTIRDQHWEQKPGGLDWDAIHAEYLPKMQQTETMDQARAVLRDMLGRLHQTHFAILPRDLYDNLNGPVAGAAGTGMPGFEIRVIDGHVIVSEGPAVPAGWELIRAGGVEMAALLAKLRGDPSIHELQLYRAVAAELIGPVGSTREYTFLDESNVRVTRELRCLAPRGRFAGFGNLPPVPVWFESRRIGNAGYIRFNWFLDLVRLMTQFGDAVERCSECDGLVIDLRGNLGGIGAMAMGMAGWLVDKPGQRLGTMYMHGATLNYTINPRVQAYTGPVAILVDGLSASTAEIFAQGLKDIGRARVFGARTAAAALPSVIIRLPNGDGFQYAVANYISEGGRALDGNGVVPDVEVRLTREALLAGHDPALDTALEWIRKQKDTK